MRTSYAREKLGNLYLHVRSHSSMEAQQRFHNQRSTRPQAEICQTSLDIAWSRSYEIDNAIHIIIARERRFTHTALKTSASSEHIYFWCEGVQESGGTKTRNSWLQSREMLFASTSASNSWRSTNQWKHKMPLQSTSLQFLSSSVSALGADG